MATSKPDPPLHFLLVLFPGFQLLDVAGPLDILNILSTHHPSTKDLTLTIAASTLDPVPIKPNPPLDPTTNAPKWTFNDWPASNPHFSQSIAPDITFESYLDALANNKISSSPTSPHKPIDILLIPGGRGTRITRTDPSTGRVYSNIEDLLTFIPAITPHIRHSIITVCTGSDILAQTGLLNSRRATSNMALFDTVAARSPRVRWLKARRWVRSAAAEATVDGFHGEIWTSAGITAGIAVMFAFVAEYYGGIEVARETARRLEYEWKEVPEGEVDPMYGLSLEALGEKLGAFER